jgi:hypothetical protein
MQQNGHYKVVVEKDFLDNVKYCLFITASGVLEKWFNYYVKF